MKQTHETIRNWYRSHGRTGLPWRTTDDPYRIYLSEVMLQQTQVKTVLERYYSPFLEKFPTLEALGEAPLDDVLKMWEGLGYYNRAKNLHSTAQILLQRGKAQSVAPALPCEIDALLKLPGIGKNTAHAVAAFAFHQPVPVMEANVRRILCRLHRLASPTDKTLWEIAFRMVDKKNPFEYNQAMMDIGATVCMPKNPDCSACPLAGLCAGKEEPALYPARKKRTVPTREQHVLLHLCGEKLSLSQRSGKFLHGLWGFPAAEEQPLPASTYLGEVTHTYTHFKLLCKVYLLQKKDPTQKSYFSLSQIEKLAISKVDEKILGLYLRTIQ
jgi:A/G-specific adenine glycosylase